MEHTLAPGVVSDAGTLSLQAVEALQDQGYAAYYVVNGDLIAPPAYRNYLERAWRLAAEGLSGGESVQSQVFGASATAFAASTFRANVVAEVPIKVTLAGGDDADWHPAQWFLDHARTLMWHIEMSGLIWGVAYLRKIYNDWGYPSTLQWLHPEDVSPQTDADDNIIEYWYLREKLLPDDVIEIRDFDPQRRLRGKAQFEVALGRVTTEHSVITHAGSFFFNGARPDGILVSKTPLDDTKRKDLEREWKAFKGSKNAWRTLVGSGEFEWIPITVPPVDLAMVELKSDIRRDICVIFQVNPALIGAGDVADPLSAGSTFNGLKRNHIENVTLPSVGEILTALNEQWLWVDFDDRSTFTLVADIAAMDILSDVTGERATASVALVAPTSPVIDYDEARAIMKLPKRDGYLRRPPEQAVQLLLNTLATVNEGRALVGLEPWPLAGDIVRLPDGSMVPLPRLLEILNQRLDTPPPTNPFGLSIAHTPTPAQLADAALPASKPASLQLIGSSARASMPECTVILSLADDDALVAALTLAKYKAADGSVVWTEPADLHLTLVHFDHLPVAMERDLYAVFDNTPVPLTMTVTGTATFEKPDRVVFILQVEPDQAVRDIQRTLYERAAAAGAQASEYSAPDDWQPHITLGYAPAGFKAPDFALGVQVHARSVKFSRPDFAITYEQPVPAALPAIVQSRAASKAQLVVSFAQNNLIRQAQRTVAKHLQEQGIVDLDWFDGDAWALPLVRFTDGPAQQVYRLAQTQVNVDDVMRFDLRTAGYVVTGDGVLGLRVVDTQPLADLRTRLIDDLGSGEAVVAVLPLARLGDTPVNADLLMLDAEYPLVAETLELRVDSAVKNAWALRRFTTEQVAELTNWQHKVRRRGIGAAFEPVHLDGTLAADFVRGALTDGADIDAIFTRAKRLLVDGLQYKPALEPTPEEYEAYWRRYDELKADLGADWSAYMKQALPDVEAWVAADSNPTTVHQVLAHHHDALRDAWVGTLEAPGPLTQLLLAGMAAGNESLLRHVAADPDRAATRADATMALTISWELLSQQALDFARSYSYGLIRGIDSTTQELVQQAFADWIQSGEDLAALSARMRVIFKDRKRAKLIAQTESIRVYNEGAFRRWKSVGVHRATWQTVRDQRVCPLCRPLQGQVADIDAGWVHPGGTIIDDKGRSHDAGKFRGKVYRDSAHPGCRCFRRPAIEGVDFAEQPKADGAA